VCVCVFVCCRSGWSCTATQYLTLYTHPTLPSTLQPEGGRLRSGQSGRRSCGNDWVPIRRQGLSHSTDTTSYLTLCLSHTSRPADPSALDCQQLLHSTTFSESTLTIPPRRNNRGCLGGMWPWGLIALPYLLTLLHGAIPWFDLPSAISAVYVA
jgi:hypothetical protein